MHAIAALGSGGPNLSVELWKGWQLDRVVLILESLNHTGPLHDFAMSIREGGTVGILMVRADEDDGSSGIFNIKQIQLFVGQKPVAHIVFIGQFVGYRFVA